ncbi:hypothetical protein BKA65DRAFT_534462 [Rhexocercosporidium sp. MPI-PUGE-AT-0058]|nr:hypothetical protein BKA65DRAFT_534462 [Rhexocercosporidium sp. MPI-PUGE-AT-0058]
MAKDMQTKKRKASVPEVGAEKVKKVKNVIATPTETPAKKRKATEDAAPAKVKKTKTPKNASEVKTSTVADKAPKGSKTTATSVEKMKGPKEIVAAAKKAIVSKNKNSTAVSENIANSAKPEIEVDEDMDSGLEDEDKDMDGESDSDADEETQNILDGFESEGDDEEVADGLPEGAEVPARKQLSKKEEKKLKKMNDSGASDKPGVIYVGRIPHGFYENEMRAYFGQFGTILKLRLSRNKKTGASKHFAWIQFESTGVADIVARTMDNYMMFSHLLKVKLIPDEQVNPDWFKGANKRFKKVPWNKMEGRKLEQGKSEEFWNTKVERESGKREKNAAKMKEIGYEFEAPKLKSAAGLAKPKAPEELTSGENEVKVIEAAPVVEENTGLKKKGKKSKGSTHISPSEQFPETNNKAEKRAMTHPPSKEDTKETVDALVAEAGAKGKKGKKTKVDKEAEVVVQEAIAVVEEPKLKEKKVKKAKVVETTISEPAVEAPEKKVKTKKSKSSLVETTVTPAAAPEEIVKKTKKGKKAKDSA